MKTQSLFLMVIVALLLFGVDSLAKGPGGGGGGGGVVESPDYGDLIILLRNDKGVPIPSDPVMVPDPETGILVNGGLCWQPIAFNVDDEGACPGECVITTTDPVTVSVNQYSCAVAEGCAGCTQEVDFGRINAARSPDSVFDSQLADVIVNLATADCLSLDPAGRLVASRVNDDMSVAVSTIDSPLQNLAISRQLLLTGTIGTPLPEGADVLDTAARGIGAGSGKSGQVNVDLVAYLNSIMGLDDVPTILDPKICETYRKEVKGVIQEVEKCFLDYGNYNYTRTTNFAGLPSPAYIPAVVPVDGWFEYLALESDPPPLFEIEQGPIVPTVFADGPGFTDGDIGGFAQAADDTRAVINFMHNWPVPNADVYATPVVCEASGDIAYDLAISEESGLQVPKQMVDGGDGREFFVTVAHVGGDDAATGSVSVFAIAENGGTIDGSPWVYNFADLLPGMSTSFTQFFNIDLGQRTKIKWTAVVGATDDVNLSNNTVTATTNVIVTGGGGKP